MNLLGLSIHKQPKPIKPMTDTRMDFVSINVKAFPGSRPCSVGGFDHNEKALVCLEFVPSFGLTKWSVVLCNEHAEFLSEKMKWRGL